MKFETMISNFVLVHSSLKKMKDQIDENLDESVTVNVSLVHNRNSQVGIKPKLSTEFSGRVFRFSFKDKLIPELIKHVLENVFPEKYTDKKTGEVNQQLLNQHVELVTNIDQSDPKTANLLRLVSKADIKIEVYVNSASISRADNGKEYRQVWVQLKPQEKLSSNDVFDSIFG